jgi:hypothetical protein
LYACRERGEENILRRWFAALVFALAAFAAGAHDIPND